MRLSRRRRLRPGDVVATATLGPRTRLVRSLLSAVGIAIGVAALVAMLGLPASKTAQFEKELDEAGANLVRVYPGQDMQTQATYPLPETAPAMLARIRPVTSVVTTWTVPDGRVYRSDLVPANQTGALSVGVAEGDLLGTFKVEMAQGEWFSRANLELPTAVLGSSAAQYLGVGVGARIWSDQRWWAVVGVLEPMMLAQELDATVFLARGPVTEAYPDLEIDAVYVAAAPAKAAAVKSVAAATANPADPRHVSVESLADLGWFQDIALDQFRNLALGLAAIALLVGGIGIANTMVVAVMERRGEIGLRRAMGARTGQIALQFVLEAALIGFTGGLIGIGLGAYLVFLITAFQASVFVVPTWVLLAGPGISMLIGALAGLYPSIKAARVSPTIALRAI
ncbi:MAG: ABC transporter permease [Micrococcales bacterium]|nr:ABC transporter permease [Micrococcales bacterium]